jgi:hypothetical protein
MLSFGEHLTGISGIGSSNREHPVIVATRTAFGRVGRAEVHTPMRPTGWLQWNVR